MAGQLFDLAGVRDRELNYHLECLCKSQAEPPEEGTGGIWDPHPSPFLRALVEAFSAAGTAAGDAAAAELAAWLSGQAHQQAAAGGAAGAHPLHTGAQPLLPAPGGHAGAPGPGGQSPGQSPGVPPGAPPGGSGPTSGPSSSNFPLATSLPWSPEVLEAARAYLLAKPLATWEVPDFLLLVDVLVHSHFPPGWAEQQAEWMAARAGIMGKVADLSPGATLEQATNALAAMPNTVSGAEALGRLRPAHVAAMRWGSLHAAENVRNATDGLRRGLRQTVLASMADGFMASAGGAPAAPGPALTQQLFDRFADFNRDWRRIAVTEAGEIKNQGFVAAQAPGSFVKRVERYRGACSFCRGLDGRIFKVVEPDDADKDGTREIWAGKTNVGRSASPNKRVDGELVPRLPSELWWAAAGVQHPHCRGVWVAVEPPLPTSSDASWKAWLGALGLPFGGS